MSNFIETIRNIQRQDVLWTDRNLSNTPFHIGFWIHKRMRRAIAENAHLAHGILVDVGCGVKPYRAIFAPYVDQHYGTEYSPESGYRGNRADVAGDASAMPFADASVDTILCTEVLEHVSHPEKVIEEFARILKPNGIIITTAPFFYPVHDEYDFFRYTDKGLKVMMERYGLKVEKVQPLTGTGLTVAIMFNFYLIELGFMWTKWMYPIGLVLRPLVWLLTCLVNFTGWIMEKVIPSDQMALNHLTVGRKI